MALKIKKQISDFIMKIYNNTLFAIFFLLGVGNLRAAVAQDHVASYDDSYNDLMAIVQQQTGATPEICQNIIMGYVGDDFLPSSFRLRMAWSQPMQLNQEASDSRYSLVEQLPHSKIAVVARNGEVSLFNDCNGKLLKRFQPSRATMISHVKSLEDNRLVFALHNNDNLKVVNIDDEEDSRLVPGSYTHVKGLEYVASEDDLVVGGEIGISVFDANSWVKKHQFDYYKVASMAAIGRRKLAFNIFFKEYGYGKIHMYDVHTKEMCPMNIDIQDADAMVTMCGQKLMIFVDPRDNFFIHHVAQLYDMEDGGKSVGKGGDFRAGVNSAVALPRAAAILKGFSPVSNGKGGNVVIIGQDGKLLQRLPQKDVCGIFPTSRGGLAIIGAHENGETGIFLWRPRSLHKQMRKQEKENERSVQKKRGTRCTRGGYAFWRRLLY